MRVWNDVRIEAEVLADANIALTDPATLGTSDNLAGYWVTDGIAVADQSGNGNTATLSTVASLPTVVNGDANFAGFAGYGEFDGVSDEVTIPTASISGTDRTYEAWVRVDNSSTGVERILGWNDGGANILNLIVNNGVLTVFSDTAGVGGVSGGPDLRDGEWHHVALSVANPAGGDEVRLLIDGAVVGTGNPSASLAASSADLIVGGVDGSTTENFTGDIAEVRVWNTARTDSDIIDNMRTELDGDESGLAVYLPLASNTNDLDPNSVAAANVGVTFATNVPDIVETTPQDINIERGLEFVRADSDALVVTGVTGKNTGDADFTDGSFTIETWFNTDQVDVRERIAAVQTENNAGHAITLWEDGRLLSQVRLENGSAAGISISTSDVAVEQWNHVAMSVDAVNKTLSMYVNGDLVETKTYDGDIDVPTGELNIGRFKSGSQHFDGELSDFRIWTEARTQAEIRQGMDEIQDPSSPNLLVSLPFNEATAGDATSVVDLTGNTNPTVIGTPTFFDAAPPVYDAAGRGIFDNFNDGSIDPNVWTIVDSINTNGIGAAEENLGSIDLTNRLSIVSNDEFAPSAQEPVVVSGQFEFNTADAKFHIFTRYDGSTPSATGGPVNGITATVRLSDDTLNFGKDVASTTTSITATTSAGFDLTTGVTYDYILVDDGTNLTFTITDGENSKTITGSDAESFATNKVSLSSNAQVTAVDQSVTLHEISVTQGEGGPIVAVEETPIFGQVVATDADGDALAYTVTTDPTHGSLQVNADGSYIYTPNANRTGADSFEIEVFDGQTFRNETINVFYVGQADAPTVNGVQTSQGAVQLDGVDDFFCMPDGGSLDISGSMTVQMWINPVDATNGTQALIGKGDYGPSGDDSFKLNINAAGNLELILWDMLNQDSTTFTSTFTISDGAWQNVGFVYDHEAGRVHFVNDGQRSEVQNAADGDDIYGGGINLTEEMVYVGANNVAGDLQDHFQGQVNDIAIWSEARTDVQLAVTNNVQVDVASEPNLAGYWQFDDVADGKATDLSGNGRNAEIGHGAPVDPFGGYATFTGSNNDTIDLGAAGNVATGTGDFTWSAWVRTDAPNGTTSFFSVGEADASPTANFGMSPSGRRD